MNLSNLLRQHCMTALRQIPLPFPTVLDETQVEITPATQEKFGHYQCNSAMKLAPLFKEPPRSLAEKWVTQLHLTPTSHTLFSKIEVAGPGFINLTLHPQFLSTTLTAQLRDPRLGVSPPVHPQNIVIDFSSPNTAKEMHVGHLRSTIIGDCLARIFRFLGHSVLPLNHVGDWGTQFGMLITAVKAALPEITNAAPPNISLHDLLEWYKAAKKRFDEDPIFKKNAQQAVVALQSGNADARQAWQHICAISRKAYQHIYEQLDVQLVERGESFYHDSLPTIVNHFERKNLVTHSEGAKCIYLEGFINRAGNPLPLILQKADGAYNYATTDLAALWHRLTVEQADRILYVVDAGQSLHFEMIFKAAQAAGFYDPKQTQVIHIPFGLVLRADGKKFKTRSGDTERLVDLIETAVQQAQHLLQARRPNATPEELAHSAHILGINAIKYADLSCHRASDYIFNYDKMLRFEGNTAAFLLYAYVRIQSIQRKIPITVQHLLQDHTIAVQLECPEEIALGLLVCQFNETLEAVLQDFCPSRLTDYLYRVAEKFHLFFHHCRVEGAPEQNSRLLLCEAVAHVLREGFQLLGLKPLNHM